MWKKDEAMPDTPREVEVPRRPEVTRSTPSAPTGRAVIGPSIMIHGEVTGNEDLLIQSLLLQFLFHVANPFILVGSC